MARLRMENASDVIDLHTQYDTGFGYEAQPGATGFGMAPRTVQWSVGAGDGARYRGKRVSQRSLDIPLNIRGVDHDDLVRYIDRLTLMLSDTFTLYFVEDNGTEWFADCVFSGGFSPNFGTDIRDTELDTVITVMAGDPYWTAVETTEAIVEVSDSTPGLLADLVSLTVSRTSVVGTVTLENAGTAPAYPVITIRGPGNTYQSESGGKTLDWNGTLVDNTETLTIDHIKKTVVDQAGVNRYADLGTAPKFWSIPPGISTATVSLLGVTTDSSIALTWRARKWLVI